MVTRCRVPISLTHTPTPRQPTLLCLLHFTIQILEQDTWKALGRLRGGLGAGEDLVEESSKC